MEDRLENSFSLLDINTIYNTTLDADLNGIGRFYIHTTTENLNTNDLPKPEIKIYSPNKNTLHIVGIESGIVNFKLYDILGKELIKTSFVGNGLNKIPMQNFEKGMYIIKLQTNNVFVSKKVILK